MGTRANDLPMVEFQQEWNKSITSLACRKAVQPPLFAYDPHKHSRFTIAMSDASDLYIPRNTPLDKGTAEIKIASERDKNDKRKNPKERRQKSSSIEARMINALGKISVLSKYKFFRQASTDSEGSATRLPDSVLPT